jgi:hypothetical protein
LLPFFIEEKQMSKWTLMATVAAVSIAASGAVAQTQDQPKNSAPPAAASEQNTRPQPQKNIRQIPMSGQSQNKSSEQTTGQNTRNPPGPEDSNTPQNTAQPNSQAPNKTGQSAAQPTNQNTSQQNSAPPVRQSTQNPSANRPAAAPNVQPNNQTGQSAQPAQNAAQARAPSLEPQQQTRISAIVSQQKVVPVTKVNFELNVGVAVPRDIRVRPLPNEIISLVPQYRGYSYFVTTDRIVIVEPSTQHIVYVMPYEGSGRAAASTATHKRSVNLTDDQRAVIRKHASPVRRETTGSRVRREITIEEEVPSAVELQEFDEPVVRAVPAMRGYRYYRNDDDVVIVEPRGRRIYDVVR